MSILAAAARPTALVLLLASAGCADQVDQAVDQSELIYGADDRREYFELTSAGLVALADSTVVLMDSTQLQATSSGYDIALGPSFGEAYSLCPGEPYAEQPQPGFCSGFQVGADLIATAGHCVDATSCAGTAFAFGFHMSAPGVVRSQLPADDVYFCSSIVGRAETATNDYAIVKVDRTIVGHAAMPVRSSGEPALGDPLVLLGHPVGLPLKVAGGANVQSISNPDYFEANVDAYGGNSGSPVVNAATGQVEGILVRGNPDFDLVRQDGRRCRISNQCSDSGCPGWEDATRASKFQSLLSGGGGGGGGVCLPKAATCSQNSDCCSNACNPKKKTCR